MLLTLATLGYLARGIGLGAAAVMPLGPMKILCLRRVLAFGALAGSVTAAGVVSGDAIFIATAAFGLTEVSAALQAASPILRITGGLALLWLSVGALRRRPPGADLHPARSHLLSMYGGTVGLTLSNPMTIVMITTMLVSAGGLEAIGSANGGVIAAGMVMGSMLVWTTFTVAAVVAGRFFSPTRLMWLNRAAAALLFWFGVSSLWAGAATLLLA